MQRDNFVKRVLVVPVVALVALLVGCGSMGSGDSEPQQDPASNSYPQEAGDEYPAEDGENGDSAERMVIRTKTIRLEVESTEDAVSEIRALTSGVSGTVTDMQVATDDGWVRRSDGGDGSAMQGWVTIRVPTESYEEFLDSAMELGTVQYQSETSEDVTQEHVDMSARLENLRAQEARLREFFEAAENVEDMLAIEQELGRVRGEIESLDAQVTYLERQAAMATVTIELTEPQSVVTPQGPSWGFVESITDGFRGAAGLLTGLITLLIATSPLWVAALVLFLPIRAAVRRRRARMEKAGGTARKSSILTTVPAPAPAPARPTAAPSTPAEKPESGATPPTDA